MGTEEIKNGAIRAEPIVSSKLDYKISFYLTLFTPHFHEFKNSFITYQLIIFNFQL